MQIDAEMECRANGLVMRGDNTMIRIAVAVLLMLPGPIHPFFFAKASGRGRRTAACLAQLAARGSALAGGGPAVLRRHRFRDARRGGRSARARTSSRSALIFSSWGDAKPGTIDSVLLVRVLYGGSPHAAR